MNFIRQPRLLVALLALWLAAPAVQAEVIRAASAPELQAALDRARPGDEILLADGRYAELELTLAVNGEEDRPIVLRAENPGAAILTGKPYLRIRGEHIIVRDLTFRDLNYPAGTRGAVAFEGSDFCRLSNVSFENSELAHGLALVSFRAGASDNRVDHCRFVNTRYRSVVVVVDDDSLKNGPPERNRIDNNLFQDVPPYGQNGAETVQVGQRSKPHSDLVTDTLIENNLFIRCDGEPEIISIKNSGNTILNNTFVNCDGELVMRHGQENTVEGNRFFGGTGGVRLSGHGHRIVGNTIVGASGTGIRLYYGTPDLMAPASYLPVYDSLISGNTIVNCAEAGIMVGANKNAHYESERWAGPPWFASAIMDCTVAPYDNEISGNIITGSKGILLMVDESPDNTFEDNILHATGEAQTGQ